MISLLTLVSRILGLVRDIVCAHAFGTDAVWSAFRMGFQIPNLFRRLFGEGALSAASIPVLTETLTRESKEAADVLAEVDAARYAVPGSITTIPIQAVATGVLGGIEQRHCRLMVVPLFETIGDLEACSCNEPLRASSCRRR